ncbi:MAG: hypothetical protein GY940_40065 [bacterium]|nr:hypothetical protein [bacterium]
MVDFTVNVTNHSVSDSVTISPVEATGFGCCVPPTGSMNFSFKSIGTSNSITLALVVLSDSSTGPAQVSDFHTEGGICNVSSEDSKPSILEITNTGEKSVTNVNVGCDPSDIQTKQTRIPDEILKITHDRFDAGKEAYQEDIPPMIVN